MVPVKISSDNDPVIGSQDAAITIIEFSDFQCPFCARFHIQTLPIIMDEYINEGKVKLVFRDFPNTKYTSKCSTSINCSRMCK